MNRILDRFLTSIVRKGHLIITYADGTRRIYGGGVGAHWAINTRMSADLAGAHSIGGNPARPDRNTRNAHAEERVWLRLSASF